MKHKTKIVKTKYFDLVDANVGGRSIHEDIPTEVLETQAILHQKMVGSFLYKKAIEIIKKYPQYFPDCIVKDDVIYSKDKQTKNNG